MPARVLWDKTMCVSHAASYVSGCISVAGELEGPGGSWGLRIRVSTAIIDDIAIYHYNHHHYYHQYHYYNDYHYYHYYYSYESL
jgi:hypothetical protein